MKDNKDIDDIVKRIMGLDWENIQPDPKETKRIRKTIELLDRLDCPFELEVRRR